MVFYLKTKGPRNEEVLQAIALLEKEGRKSKKKIWKDIATRLKKPRRNRVKVNIWKLNKLNEKLGKKYLFVPGKVLGFGEVDREMNVIALQFSETASKKIAEKGKRLTIAEALKQGINPKEIAIVA